MFLWQKYMGQSHRKSVNWDNCWKFRAIQRRRIWAIWQLRLEFKDLERFQRYGPLQLWHKRNTFKCFTEKNEKYYPGKKTYDSRYTENCIKNGGKYKNRFVFAVLYFIAKNESRKFRVERLYTRWITWDDGKRHLICWK